MDLHRNLWATLRRLPLLWLGCASLLDFHSSPLPNPEWTHKLDHGSVKGYPSLDQASSILYEWVMMYAHVLKQREIGRSFEDRPINAYVLGACEGACPQVLVTSLMHAREPTGLTVLLFFLGQLLELYSAGHIAAKYVLERREIWFVPFVNPDGYVANAGMRHKSVRKNRRPTCSQKDDSGVDLNRNFGTHWNNPRLPDENDKCSEAYQGTQAFSEPETKAIKGICDDNNFKLAVNFHAYGRMLTHPYNFGRQKLPEDVERIYKELAVVYDWPLFGTAVETVKYAVPGSSDDWMFDAKGIVAMSPELGPEEGGFWPSAKLVAGINTRNFHRTVYVALKAGLQLDVALSGLIAQELVKVLGQKPAAKIKAAGLGGSIFRLQLLNTGLSDSSGQALNVAIAADSAEGTEEAQFPSRVLGVLDDDGTPLPFSRVDSSGWRVPTVQLTPLKRRSSRVLYFILEDALPQRDVYLRICVHEADLAASVAQGRDVCQCATGFVSRHGTHGAKSLLGFAPALTSRACQVATLTTSETLVESSGSDRKNDASPTLPNPQPNALPAPQPESLPTAVPKWIATTQRVAVQVPEAALPQAPTGVPPANATGSGVVPPAWQLDGIIIGLGLLLAITSVGALVLCYQLIRLVTGKAEHLGEGDSHQAKRGPRPQAIGDLESDQPAE